MFIESPKIKDGRDRAKEFLELEERKQEFTEVKFKMIEDELGKLSKIPEKQRNEEQTTRHEILKTLLTIKFFQDKFENNRTKEALPGIETGNSVCLMRGVYEGSIPSESAIKSKIFADLKIDDYILRQHILNELYQEGQASFSDSVELDKMKIGGEKVISTDISGMEIVIAKPKREPGFRSKEEEERLKKVQVPIGGWDEVVLVRFYNPEDRAREIAESEK